MLKRLKSRPRDSLMKYPGIIHHFHRNWSSLLSKLEDGETMGLAVGLGLVVIHSVTVFYPEVLQSTR
ncbi:hypothetical protein X798_00437 [Onchocerca flexuosa]|uniref:Plug_translocon domain-containing protein n=2 Tax=Onchocerca flexuosa TaxID=387005 RepID=A0A183HZS7_9BILA|nr:hypothetical protein X798_00437 [Onchocerca flexuosa]VDP12662.1 unnamed protein product [Onchocerca flexuosa]